MVRFHDGSRLFYNRGFRQPTSYSVGLRPDYILVRDGRPWVAFDAKFRFDPLVLPSAASESGGENEEYEQREKRRSFALSAE